MVTQYYNRNSGEEHRSATKILMNVITFLSGSFDSMSVEIVGRNFGGADLQRLHPVGLNRDHVVEILQGSFNQQELLANQQQAIVLEQIGSDDGIGNASFVFQAEEDKSVSGAGTLAGNHAASDTHAPAIVDVLQVAGALHSPQVGAPVSHGV